jgi:hypothetical protein
VVYPLGISTAELVPGVTGTSKTLCVHALASMGKAGVGIFFLVRRNRCRSAPTESGVAAEHHYPDDIEKNT